VLVQEGKLAHTSFPPQWNDVRDVLVLVQEGKLARASFPPWWIVLFEMFLCLCKRES
jgi:hypothetical protein